MAFEYREFPLSEDDFSRRIDKILRKFLPKMPLSLIYKALRTGKILINHKKVDGKYITCANDILYVENFLFENFQKEVAEKLGIYQSNVSDWENDVSRPEYERLIQLTTLYACTIAELLGVEENC